MPINFEEVFRDPAIDPSRVVKQQLLKYQEPMNAVIERGDSPVQQFYRGATVLVTGGSGFLGKQLIEKLFRSCDINKLFVLLRPRKGKTIQQRKEYMLKDPVFNNVRSLKPEFADKIVPVEGDVTQLKLGMDQKQWELLTEEVDTIFHGAATVRFNAPLKEATLTNVRGTRETLTLARSCRNLKNYVYVSTAYTHATYDKVGKEVTEQFYECPVTPDLMMKMAETFSMEQLDEMTPELIQNWPNTYTFTKAIAEELIRLSRDLPACVVKPPIVIGAYCEPSPGWLDINAIQGPSGILLGIILGVLHAFYVDIDSHMAMTPVDYVNNCTIAAGWDAAQRRHRSDNNVPLYIVANKNKLMSWRGLYTSYDSKNVRKMPSPKAVGYCYLVLNKNRIVYNSLALILHYIPAYIADAVCYIIGKRPKGVKSFVDIFRTIDKFTVIFDYFLSNTWDFKDDNVQAMMSNMTDADRAIYNCDVNTIDLDDLSYAWGLGLREFIIKDGLTDNAKAQKKQKIMRVVDYALKGIYIFIFWKILCFIFFLSYNVFQIVNTFLKRFQ